MTFAFESRTRPFAASAERRLAVRWPPVMTLVCLAVVALTFGVGSWSWAQADAPAEPRGEWVVADIGPLRLLVEPGPAEAQLDRAVEIAEAQLPRLFEDFGFDPAEVDRLERFHLVLADRMRWGDGLRESALGPEAAAVRRLDRRAPVWAAGYQLARDRLGVVRLDRVDRYPFDGLASVLVHEISHQLLFDRVGARAPRWFDEALAMHEARRRGARDLVVLASASLFSPVPPLSGLDWEFQRSEVRARRAYAAGFEFLDWSLKREARRREEGAAGSSPRSEPVQVLLGGMADDPARSFEEAWREAFGEPLWLTEQEWREGRWRIDRWAPVLLFNANLWWSLIALLALLAALVRRRRTRRQHEAWEVEERDREELDGVPQAEERGELERELKQAVAQRASLRSGGDLESIPEEDLRVN